MLVQLTAANGKNLNAITPSQPYEAEERTARHMRICVEMADLAMQLARAAAARALADWAEPETPPHPAKLPLEERVEPSFEGTWQAPSDDASAPHQDQLTAPHTEQPVGALPQQAAPPRATRAATPGRATARSPKRSDPAIIFTRLAAVVRYCIALESRLAAGAPNVPRASVTPADPRRELLCEAFSILLKNHPDRAPLMREATTRLDARLAAGPDPAAQPAQVLSDICKELGIPLDPGKLIDKSLLSPDEKPSARATDPPR